MSNALGISNLSLNREEAYYYWFHVVKAFFVLVTNGSASQVPTEAFFFPAPDWNRKFPNILFYGTDISHWMPESNFHAIHISVQKEFVPHNSKVEGRTKFEAVVVSPERVKDLSDAILFGGDELWPVPLSWQHSVWDDSLLADRNERRKLEELYRLQQGESVPPRSVLNRIGTGSLWLFLAMMDRYWRAKKEDYKGRAADVTSAGIPGNHSSSSIRIQASKIGFRRPTVQGVQVSVDKLKRDAAKFFRKNPKDRLLVETTSFPLPVFPVPEELDDSLTGGREVRYDDDYRGLRMVHKTSKRRQS